VANIELLRAHTLLTPLKIFNIQSTFSDSYHMTHSILLNHHPLKFLHPVHKALDRMLSEIPDPKERSEHNLGYINRIGQ